MLKRMVRLVFYSIATITWIVALAFAGELLVRAYVLVSERFYASFFEAQNRKVYRMVPAEELAEAAKAFSLSAADRSGYLAEQPESATPAPGVEDVAAREAARDAFAQGDAEKAALIATVRGEARATLTPERDLLSVSGDPLLELYIREWSNKNYGPGFPEPVLKGLQQLKETREMGPVPFVWDSRYTLEADAQYIRGHVPNPDHIELRIREVPPVFALPDPPVAPDRSSEIPSVRYRRNWFVPGEMATYNNYGFRDDDVVMPKPEGLFRVVCVGGSTTEEGNNNTETYPNQMERKLQAVFGKEHIEVINCGISGITSYNERRRMDDYLELDPDLIVYYNGVNDACHEHMWRWLAEVQGNARKLLYSATLTRLFNRHLLPPDDYLLDYMRRSTFRNIRAMAYRAKERGVPFAVCSFAYPREHHLNFRDRIFLNMNLREVYHGQYLTYPSYTHVMDLHNQLVREVCAEDDLLYIPAAERLDAGMDHFFDLCHMTPLGLELKSTIITEYVRAIVEPGVQGS